MAPVVGDGEAGFRYDASEGRALRAARVVAELRGTARAARRAATAARAPAAACCPARWRRCSSASRSCSPSRPAASSWPVERVRVIPQPPAQARRAGVPHVASAVLGRKQLQLRLPRTLHRREDAPHGLAAARSPITATTGTSMPGTTSARRCAVSRSTASARAKMLDDGRARHRRGRTRRAPGRQLRHLLRRAQGLGDDRVQRQGRALGRRRALAFAAAGPLPARWPLRTQGALQRLARAADGRAAITAATPRSSSRRRCASRCVRCCSWR